MSPSWPVSVAASPRPEQDLLLVETRSPIYTAHPNHHAARPVASAATHPSQRRCCCILRLSAAPCIAATSHGLSPASTRTTEDDDDDGGKPPSPPATPIPDTGIERDACVHSRRREASLLLSLALGVVTLVSRR